MTREKGHSPCASEEVCHERTEKSVEDWDLEQQRQDGGACKREDGKVSDGDEKCVHQRGEADSHHTGEPERLQPRVSLRGEGFCPADREAVE